MSSNISSFAETPAEYGNAVVLSSILQGKLTACGQYYNENLLVAAHKTLPCGTKVTITNLTNYKSVEVTIVERGPYVRGQITSLSKAAAAVIGMKFGDLTKVKLELTNAVSKENSLNNRSDKSSKQNKKELNIIQEAAEVKKGGLYKMQVLKLEPKGWGVQVAGYSTYESVIQQISVLQEKWFKGALVFVDEKNANPYYKIIMGPFFSKEEAESYLENMKNKYEIKDAFVVDLESLNMDNK